MHETIDGSVVKYYDLHSLEAAQRTFTLQQALDQMADLNRQRGNILRTSSHDLKGSLGIISGAASMLKRDGLNQQQREKHLAMLNRNLNNVQSMLGSLMDLARGWSGSFTGPNRSP